MHEPQGLNFGNPFEVKAQRKIEILDSVSEYESNPKKRGKFKKNRNQMVLVKGIDQSMTKMRVGLIPGL